MVPIKSLVELVPVLPCKDQKGRFTVLLPTESVLPAIEVAGETLPVKFEEPCDKINWPVVLLYVNDGPGTFTLKLLPELGVTTATPLPVMVVGGGTGNKTVEDAVPCVTVKAFPPSDKEGPGTLTV